MILIDTSVWAQFLRMKGNPEIKKRVAFLIDRDQSGRLAAYTERRLRRKHLTVKRDDILIATIAHVEQLPLLCRDKHFACIRDQGELELELEQLP